MTGRVCPVHGEWSATGVCRWCEPEPKRMPTNLPTGSVPCRCGEYSWLPECATDMREGVLGGMFHSPAQCFKLDADPPASDAYAAILGPPPDAAKILRTYKPEYLNRIGFTATEPCLEYAHAAEESRLDAQHAALRWERVARRWNYKHRAPGGPDERERAYVWRSWLMQMNRQYAILTWTPGQPP